MRLHKRSVAYCGSILLLATLALASCSSEATSAVVPAVPHTIASASKIADASESGIPEVGTAAPDFEYTMADGSTHTLSELRGKKVLLNFWATWCGPCRSEMPDLQKALGDAGGSVVVLGVNKAEQADVIAPFASQLGVSFPLIANSAGDIAGRYAAQLLPTTYFINSDGTIALRKTGQMNESFIKNHLADLK